MDIVSILGRVYPAGYKVQLVHEGTIYKADDGTLSGKVDVRVVNSAIVVRWTLDHEYNKDLLLSIWTHSKRLATGLVDLIAFRQGMAANVVLDRYVEPGGAPQDLAFGEPAVQGLATSLPDNDDKALLAVFRLMADEQQLLLVLEDLITGLSSQDHKAINCARCVEAVRQLLAGYDLTPVQQWPIIRDKLNLGEAYLNLIMSNSLNYRHGKQVPVDPALVTEIMKRTWTVIDRFFHFRLGGNQKLDAAKFPVLTDP